MCINTIWLREGFLFRNWTEQRPARSEGVSVWTFWEETLKVEGTAKIDSVREKHSWYLFKIFIYLFWLEDNYNIVMVFVIYQHELAIGIRVSPPSWTTSHLPPHFGCPVSYIKLPLATSFTYANVYVSMLFFQIIPPFPYPTESKSLFFTSVSPLLPCMLDHWYHLSRYYIYIYIYIYINVLYVSFSFWLTSICIIGQKT